MADDERDAREPGRRDVGARRDQAPDVPGSPPDAPGSPPDAPGSPPDAPGSPPDAPGSPPDATAGSPPDVPGSPPDARTIARRAVVLACALALAVVAVVVVANVASVEAGPLVWAVALTPWYILACAIIAAVAAVIRSRGIAVLAALLAGAVALTQVPTWIPALRSGDDDPVLTVATLNARYGHADAEQVVALVRERHVDLLGLQELTPELVDALDAAGLGELLPYSVVEARPGAGGVALYSRAPIDEPETIGGLQWPAVSGVVPAQGSGMRVVVAHPPPPGLTSHDAWSRDLERLRSIAAEGLGPLMIMGDLNATVDHGPVRALMEEHLRDAASQAGNGFAFTFPSDAAVPPLVAIDHVLVRYTVLVATRVEAVTVRGSDHRALVVTYSGP